MAGTLEGVLANLPGLSGYLAKKQFDNQQSNQELQGLAGGMGLLAQIQKQQEMQRKSGQEQAFRSELHSLGPTPDQGALAAVAARYAPPADILKTQQASLDRQAQMSTTLAAAKERIAAQIEAARQRGEDQRTLAAMQIEGRKELAGIVAGLRQPPQPRNLQLTTDAEGNQLIVNPDGTTRPLTTQDGAGVRKPVAADKPMTEFQGKAALYGTRSAQSDKILKSLEDKISTTGLAAGQATGYIGNALMSSDQRRVDQAQRDFVNAVLRQESGAVISDAEFANAKKQYFPQPGDDAKTVSQKRANRQLAVQGFARMSGPKGAVDIKAIIDAPLLPGVDAISPTPLQASGATSGYIEMRRTSDGRVLGKKPDGTVEEIK